MTDPSERALSKAKRARWAGRKMVALLQESDLDYMRDSWREDFLKTLDDVAMRVELARVIVAGGPSDSDVRGLSGDSG